MVVGNGQLVKVKTAFGTFVEKRAVTGVISGDSMKVVRVCSDEEWRSAQNEGRAPVTTPWPAEDVSVLQTELVTSR